MIRPGKVWLDTSGSPIQAHGGGITRVGDAYYWYGEDKSRETLPPGYGLLAWIPVTGHRCYSSRDLSTWKDEGLVLPAVAGVPGHDLAPEAIVERPKVLFNAKTGLFVMWTHVDMPDYGKARCAVAVSRNPAGPFEFKGSFRPDGHDSRDFIVFQDDDGMAWLYHSSEWNKTLHISRLTDDYLGTTGKCVRAFEGKSREAPVVFRSGGKYFLVSSGCTGWDANEAEYAVADSPEGPWKVMGSPINGSEEDRKSTFHGQASFALPVKGKPGRFVLMLDQWNPANLRESRYAWLPMVVEGERVKVEWKEEWDPMRW